MNGSIPFTILWHYIFGTYCMNSMHLDKDISVFYITAGSFPSGIMNAQQQLHALVPYSDQRKYFGLSRPENGTIIYHAAAEELEPGEGRRLGCSTLVIKSGEYLRYTIKNYSENIESIAEAFKLLLQQPGLDPEGYCVEWYFNATDVHCMVRLGN